MIEEYWEKIRHFSPHENWGDTSCVDLHLVQTLDSIRHFVGFPFIITCGTQGEHTHNSYHYKGKAADGHFATERSFAWQVAMVLYSLEKMKLSRKIGLGIYQDWTPPGFHIDVRGEYARWGRLTLSGYTSFESVLRALR